MSKKMKLIPLEKYLQLSKSKDIPTGVEKGTLISKNSDATDILNNQSIPDDIKLDIYSVVMNTVREKLNEVLTKPVNVQFKVPVNISHSNTDKSHGLVDRSYFNGISSSNQNESPVVLNKNDNIVISSIPPKFRQPASIILSVLKQNRNVVSWDKEGRVTFFKSEHVAGSNITDLLNYAIRELTWADPPSGTNRFLAACKILNVPTHLLSKEVRKDWYSTVDHIQPRNTTKQSAMNMNRFYSNFKNWEPIV
jgi:hypothetical protein